MDVVIIGGGISGLFAAEELLKKNISVIILESKSLLGGLASSFKVKNKFIPCTYHHLLPNEKIIFNTISDKNFEKNVIWNNSSISFWFNNKPFLLTKPLDILLFKPLSWNSKFNLVKLGLISFLKSDWNNLKGLDAKSWVKKVAGTELSKKLFEPLSSIKFGKLSSVSAAWFGERLHEAVINKENYAYLNCGLQIFIDSIGNSIEKKGGQIYLNANVVKINGNKVHAIINGEIKIFKANKIISSLPPPVLKKITDLNPKEQKLLDKVRYKPMICMVAGSKDFLTPYYWNVFINPKVSFGGIFNHTALYPEGGIDGEHLYYFFTYLNEKDVLFLKSEKEIQEIYLKDIKKINSEFQYSWTKIFKIKHSSPMYTLNYENLPIKLNETIYLTGIYLMHPSTRTMNSAAKSGLETAKCLIKDI